jgi:hypothetical protein
MSTLLTASADSLPLLLHTGPSKRTLLRFICAPSKPSTAERLPNGYATRYAPAPVVRSGDCLWPPLSVEERALMYRFGSEPFSWEQA